MRRRPTLHDVFLAHRRLSGRVRATPVTSAPALSNEVGSEVLIKWENQQLTGSFKVRGALNALDALSPDQHRLGVVTASSGNHAQALGYAASLLGIPATIVVPENTPETKKAGSRRLGVELVVRGDSYDQAEAHAWHLAKNRGLVYVHSYDDPDIIAGQGTVALETLLEHPDLDAIVVPAGGGGLISGVSITAKAINPAIRIIGVQPEVSPKWRDSFEHKQRTETPYRPSYADGLPGDIGELNLEIVLQQVDEFIVVKEDSIAHSVAWLTSHGQIVEGSGAVGIAAFKEGQLDHLRGKKVLTIASGGNIDLQALTAFLDGYSADLGVAKDTRL